MRRSLTKRNTLRRRKDINRVFSKSKTVFISGIKLFYIKNNLTYTRVLISLIRRYGNAVQRNRARRVFKAVYRDTAPYIKQGWDLAVVLKPQDSAYFERKNNFLKLVKRIDLLETGFVQGGSH